LKIDSSWICFYSYILFKYFLKYLNNPFILVSYVVQNFSKFKSKIVITPRFKVMIMSRQVNLPFVFSKFQLTNSHIKSYNTFLFFFYAKGLFNFFYNVFLRLSSNYNKQFTNTSIFWAFKTLDGFLYSKKFSNVSPIVSSFFLYNSYFLSVKINNAKIFKTYFKSVFFFSLFYFTEQWYQFTSLSTFRLNFFFVRNNFKLYKFFGGYFFKVYNY